MANPKCPRCQQDISVEDTITLEGDQVAHVDCRRPRDLSPEERALLFNYCFDHAVADCGPCGKSHFRHELASDLIGHRTLLCPTCRTDLTGAIRAHLYHCATLPAEIRLKVRELREATGRLVKRSQEIVARADVLMREAEAAVGMQSALLSQVRAALAELRATMQRFATK